MAASLVLELQRLACDSHSSVAELLRKALVVATKLKLSDFREWIQNEQNGFEGKKLPDYRMLPGRLTALTDYGERPLAFGDPEIDHLVSTAPITGNMAELEQLAQSTDPLHVALKGGQIQAIVSAFPHHQFVPQLVISPASIRGIVEAVRTVILEWSLQLEQQGILGDGMTFSDEEKKKATASHNIHIGNFQGVLGDVHGQNVQIGDYGAIHDQLKAAGVSQAERNELENIMDALKKAKPEEKAGIVQKGMDWVGKNAANLGAIASTLHGLF